MKEKSNMKITPFRIKLDNNCQIKSLKSNKLMLKDNKLNNLKMLKRLMNLNKSNFLRMKKRNSKRSKSKEHKKKVKLMKVNHNKSKRIKVLLMSVKCYSSKIKNFNHLLLMNCLKKRTFHAIFSKSKDHLL